MTEIAILHDTQTQETETYEFELSRKTGKNKSLAKGNQMINSNDRYHFILKSQLTEYLRTLACEKVREQSGTELVLGERYNEDNPCTILITICPPTNRRMDAPNFYPTVKALIDGMTDAGLWSDDNNDVILMTAFKRGETTTNKKYTVKITITGAN